MGVLSSNSEPKISVEISGKRIITDMYKTYQFPVDEKLETKLTLNADEGEKSIYLGFVSPIRMIIIDAPVQDDDVDDYTTILTITTLGTGVASGTETDQVIEIHGFNCLRFPQSFGERITNIKLSSDSVDDISVDVRLYSKTLV